MIHAILQQAEIPYSLLQIVYTCTCTGKFACDKSPYDPCVQVLMGVSRGLTIIVNPIVGLWFVLCEE